MDHLTFNIYNILTLFGAFQGFLLAILLISARQFRKISNAYLALLLFTLSILNLIGSLESLGVAKPYTLFALLPIHWTQLIPVSIYFFVSYLILPEKKMQPLEYLLFAPFLIESIYRGIKLKNYLTSSMSMEDFKSYYYTCNVFEIIAISLTLVVLLYCVRLIDKYHSHLLERFSEFEDISLKWLKYTLICGGFLSLLWAIVAYYDFDPGVGNSKLPGVLWIGISINIYWIGYSMFFRRELFEIQLGMDMVNGNDKKTIELSSKSEDHYQFLLRLMNEEKLYQNPDLSMSMLSEKTKLSNGYLSQIINQKEGKNFFDFVNEYRIDEVKESLNDPKFDHYSILGIALKAGFKSKSTFNSVFKKRTGLTPSEFKSSLNS